jgi:hypothetical protein
MRKTLLILAAAGFLYFCYVVMTDWYNGVESNLEGNNAKKLQAARDIAGYEVPGTSTNNKTTASSAPKPLLTLPKTTVVVKPSSTSPVANQSNMIVCLKDVDAYSPTNSTHVIGKFGKNTKLTIGSKDPVSGKYHVTFQPPTGQPINVLCKAEDVGK